MLFSQDYFLIGNDGHQHFTTGPPATSKNCISVGATENPPGSKSDLWTIKIVGEEPSFVAVMAAFGGDGGSLDIPPEGILVTAVDGMLACEPLVGQDLSGTLAVILRGTCLFTEKTLNAQRAGAVGVIVYNSNEGAPIVMGGTDNTVTIPALMVGYQSGLKLRSKSGTRVKLNILPSIATFSASGPTYDQRFKPDILGE